MQKQARQFFLQVGEKKAQLDTERPEEPTFATGNPLDAILGRVVPESILPSTHGEGDAQWSAGSAQETQQPHESQEG